MKKISRSFLLLASLIILLTACSTSKDYLVVFHTPYGDMTAILYEETPIHKKNFIKLVESGQYDSTTFHRIIEDFMIQGGDINAKPGLEDDEKVNYKLNAEITDQFFHVKGALAAARMGDNVNPEKQSSGSQFYIVDGSTFEPSGLIQLAEGRKAQEKQNKLRQLLGMQKYAALRNEVIEMQKNEDMEGLVTFMEEKADSLIALEFGKIELYQFSSEQQEAYSTMGGAPHLDGEYTVFGKVVEGLNVVDSIASVRTGQANKPIEDIYMTVELKRASKKSITEEYGYQYPKTEE